MEGMTSRSRRFLWVGILCGLALLAVGGFFVSIGLDKADKYASILGFFIGAIGLIVAVYAIISQGSGRPTIPPGNPSNPEINSPGTMEKNVAKGNTYNGDAQMIIGDHGTMNNN